ncbi:uncharacterized protein BO97DRAFT_394394 [Aspergillus homomorphus CBS 101889]|uniref:DNA replication checkpoint mediator MRC1 domain-containing protein n=1 Tax=Aspergillus homomorphus (strain CBS 101889) TaxID=1450537 RepID=A0A395HS27_ASPHC|nr:hypothetical protein BO97DRAFT_394394 [Aspergillus homomorphus CBS 101889]RAL10289.1 hypothetical protein BO97DRAFT_394394 [Aspergillus homomorphus CBS 101889]
MNIMSSTPSTPRTTTRSASPETAEPLLTPGRKIKAMLAAFDSDSDSETEGPQNGSDKTDDYQSTTRLSDALKKSRISSFVGSAGSSQMMVDGLDEEDEEEEEEDVIRPKGRMAARLQGGSGAESMTAFERVSKSLRAEKEGDDDNGSKGNGHEEEDDDEDDDLPTAGPRRRGITNASKSRLLPDPGLEEEEEENEEEAPARAYSPLFVSSPVKGRDDDGDADKQAMSDEDDDENTPKPPNSRFLALVAQKRKEREEKEKAEAERRAAARAANQQQEQPSDSEMMMSASEGEGDSASGAKFRKQQQQQSRPAARKASKKALEEMNRETQRMSRNMQLAHQAQTKKKISKESFFARFNSMQPAGGQDPAAPAAGENSSSTTESQNSSDAEAQKEKETPRTSPVLGPVEKVPTAEGTTDNMADGPEFPTLEDILANPRPQPEEPIVARVEVEATASKSDVAPPKKENKVLTVSAVRVRLSREEVARQQQDDSDSDLEIVTSPAKCRRIAAFENLPAKKLQEPASMVKLKALAHLTSPNRKSKGMNGAQLSATSLLKARQQAAKERQERIEELRAKGIHIETAEERAAMEDELENLVEKARMEADAIAKQERKAAKRDGDDDEDEDEDYDYSGSEDGAESGEDEDEEMADAQSGGGELVDSAADEGDESEDDKSEIMSSEETEMPTQRRKRQTRVISDDEDEDEEQEPKTPAKPIIAATTPGTRSVDRPHLPAQNSNDLMSLTQAFAGTIAGSPQRSQQTPAATLPNTLPEPGHDESDSRVFIRDSQVPRAESHDILSNYAQSTARVSESPAPRSLSGFSQIPDPTQDEGFILSPFDPLKRFLGTPQSTIETVIVDQNQSPVPTRSIRHLKRGGRAADLSMIEEQEEGEGDFEISVNAFNVVKGPKKSKEPAVLFDKSKSKAKDIVEEAAEESDDEYAGLGGGSDDDDDDEENAFDRQMINDNSGETVDEKQLAALNAHHQRTNDEKQVAKLLKDITTGALRRRRGANADDEFDLDDSDDELLARRREKQREFARMRKALLADEKIGEIAENPKKAAFFRAVEDRDDDDDEDLGFDFMEEEDESQQDSNNNKNTQPDQPETQQNNNNDNTTTDPLQNDENNNNKRKRPLDPATESTYNRPPPHLRRKPASAMSKKPATLAEIRETLSFLTETHEYDSFHEDASLDHEDNPEETLMDLDPTAFDSDSDDELAGPTPSGTHKPQNPQQPPANLLSHHPRRTRGPVVDRLALLRQASSNSASTTSASTSASGGKLAFATNADNNKTQADGSGIGIGMMGFHRPPSFIRRSTSSSSSSGGGGTTSANNSRRSSMASVNSGHGSSKSTTTTTNANPGGIKKGGAVNYYTAAREREREKQLRMQRREGGAGSKSFAALLKDDKRVAGRLGALGGKGQWE